MCEKSEKCNWEYSDFACCYSTDCLHAFPFSEGDTSDNDFKYCPFCGKEILEVKEETKT